jgi:hypothetical protein
MVWHRYVRQARIITTATTIIAISAAMTLAAPLDGAIPIISQCRSEVLGEALGPLLARANGDKFFAPPVDVTVPQLAFINLLTTSSSCCDVGDHAGRSVLWHRAI